MSWTEIFRDAVPAVAGVTVYDSNEPGRAAPLGRYIVAKAMKLPNGKFRTTQTNYCQRPAALAYARKFLSDRAAKAGLHYAEGSGRGTIMGFRPDETSPVLTKGAA